MINYKYSPYKTFFNNWLKYIILVCIVAITASIFLQGYNDFLASYFLIPFFFAFIYFANEIWKNNSDRSFVSKLFIYSLIFRLVFLFVFTQILLHYHGMPFLSYRDDYIYDITAKEIVNRWRMDGIGFYNDINFSTGSYSGFPNFSAILMYIFGDSYIVPRIGNAFLSSYSCVLVYKIANLYTDNRNAKLLSIIFMFSPLLLLFSSLQLKDTLLLFLSLVAVYSVIKLLKEGISLKRILILVFSFVGMLFVRPAAIIPIISAYFLIAIYSSKFKNQSKILSYISIILVVIGIYYSFSYVSSIGLIDVGDYFDSRYSILSTKSIFDTDANITSFSFAKIATTPFLFIFSFFLPPPLIAVIDQDIINYSSWGLLFHITLLPFIIVGMINSIKNRKQNLIPFYLFLVFLIFKIGQASSIISIFDPRQSLTTMFMMYFFLPLFNYDRITKKIRLLIILIALLITITYTMIRLYSHGLL